MIALIASFFYTPLYVRIVLRFGVVEPGVINETVSLLTSAGLLLAALVLGGILLLRNQAKREIFVSAAILSAYGLLLMLAQLLTGSTTGPAAVCQLAALFSPVFICFVWPESCESRVMKWKT